LQLNNYSKTQQDNKKIALSNCNHKQLSCHVISSPHARLYEATINQSVAATALTPAELMGNCTVFGPSSEAVSFKKIFSSCP